MKNLDHQKAVPAWKIWANPIVRRYGRSRLRPAGFGVTLLLVLMISAFLFFVSREGSARTLGEMVDVARMPLIPLLILQGLILFGMGTGQAAAGITTEADEGVLDYQRLAPMTPLAKVLGYLFGLPIREWLLFAATMPFTLWSAWKGAVPAGSILQLYAVFVMAAILYHLTGLLAGSVMKNRRWAFLASTGMVFLLYMMIPQAAKFGLVYLKYVTIYPVFNEVYPHLLGRSLGDAAELVRTLAPQARFFGLNLPQWVFTLISQGVLAFTMVMMLWRRWRSADCHLLDKVGATGFFAWLQVMLLGNALPLITSGELFPSQELNRRFGQILSPEGTGWRPEPGEAMFMIALYGLVTLLVLWWLAFLISPVNQTQVRGWRRARKLGESYLPRLSDAATATPWVLLMAGLGAVGWFIFARELMNSHWYPELSLIVVTPLAMGLILLCGGLGLQAVLERYGRKRAVLLVIFTGILPLMLAVVMALSSDALSSPAIWMGGICPALWPFYGTGVFLLDGTIPDEVAEELPLIFWFVQGVAFISVLWLLFQLRKARAEIARGPEEPQRTIEG